MQDTVPRHQVRLCQTAEAVDAEIDQTAKAGNIDTQVTAKQRGQINLVKGQLNRFVRSSDSEHTWNFPLGMLAAACSSSDV